MPERRNESFLGLGLDGFHRIHYQEWGARNDANTLVCVHGLTRNSHDFDFLAAKLSEHYRVVCPDLAGRGESDWLEDPKHYNLIQYNADMNALIARLGCEQVDWIGTSLGGLLGMILASMPRSPIRKLVINDIGPYLPHAALYRLGRYVGQAPDFEDFESARAYLTEVYAPFGPLTEETWHRLVKNSIRQDDDGRYRLRYDPRIGDSFRKTISVLHFSLWKYWDEVRCPVLIIRGKESDFLSRETAEEMCRRGDKVELVEIDGVGHTPMLSTIEEVTTIRDWLRSA
ncbi:MAG: alpha/beta hydrolase [Gammaproteobacteria bacterium]|nr:alpha/beta hydrolase [Gammaproteobacteria bacterium]